MSVSISLEVFPFAPWWLQKSYQYDVESFYPRFLLLTIVFCIVQLSLSLSLLEDEALADDSNEAVDHGLLTAPIVTREVLELSPSLQATPFGVLGRLLFLQYVLHLLASLLKW